MSKNIILSTIYKLVFKDNTNIAYVGQSTNINSIFKHLQIPYKHLQIPL